MSKRKLKKTIAQQAYDALAEAYVAMVDTKPHNAYYERPAMLSLLPDVTGKRVLDAGCGPGSYSEWLLDHGAEVIAFDANPKMVNFARERLGTRAVVYQATLEAPLSFLADAIIDIVLCPLAMDYVKDWQQTFSEFNRVMKADGTLIFSMEHPFEKFQTHRQESRYFDTDLVEYTWRGFGFPVTVPSYRRPLSAILNPLVAAGLTFDCVLEPLPTPEFKHHLPEDYQEYLRSPGFLCLRAIKK